MKRIKYFLSIFAALLLVLSSCTKEITTEDNSSITNYITYTLEGGDFLTIPVGSAFVDPGYKGMEGTTDVTADVEVDGEVDGMAVGLYTINYSAVNKDGFASSATRTVIIYDPAAPPTDITGKYTSKIFRFRPSTGASVNTGGFTVNIKKLAPGFFYVSDYLGGYYEQGLGYGPSYACTGYLQFNADNTLTLVSSYVKGWGDSLDQLVNGTYDPATKEVFWRADYAAIFQFNVTLTLN